MVRQFFHIQIVTGNPDTVKKLKHIIDVVDPG